MLKKAQNSENFVSNYGFKFLRKKSALKLLEFFYVGRVDVVDFA